MNKLSSSIRDIDMFGHPIELNFNKKGSTHNTVVGGFFSIFIKSFLLFYVIYIFYQMFTFGNDVVRNATFSLLADSESGEKLENSIDYGDMQAKLFLVFRWQF